ncbi:MAG: hypothetical protein QM626_10720 [Microbacterium sp.]|uniref:hypothetical protein n=1 Tax=Microbacterium sp. TaxID=51671 RepID=UPI0039E5D321
MAEPVPPAAGRRRGLIVAVVILAALLLVVATSLVTLLLTGRLTGTEAVATPSVTASATPTPTATATATATATTVAESDDSGSSGSGSSGGSSGSSGGSTTSTGSISSADVFVEGDDSCATSVNVSLVGSWSATGTTLWFGVNTTDASSAPYQQWSLTSATAGTVDGFVYDCSRSSENYTFTLLRTDGTKTSTTITLHNCTGLEDQSPRRSCAAE